MCALCKLTICLLMFVKSFVDIRHLGRSLYRNVMLLERGSEKEEIHGTGKRTWKEISKMSTELHFSPVLKARAGGEKHFQGDLAALSLMFVSVCYLSVWQERENKEDILWTGHCGSVSPDTGFEIMSHGSHWGIGGFLVTGHPMSLSREGLSISQGHMSTCPHGHHVVGKCRAERRTG